jgi:DNA-binding MarR family transcriptional regulator
MSSSARPGPDELAAWRAFLVGYRWLADVLEAELRAATGLNLARYDVLLHLSEAPGHSLRMTDLAAAVLLSKSGLTRLVDRMCAEGLVARARDDGDRRSFVVSLTAAGARALRRAAPVHLQGIQRHFADHLQPGEAPTLQAIFDRLSGPTA